MYNNWTTLLCDSVEMGEALRLGDDCYFRIRVEEDKMIELLWLGFVVRESSEEMCWGDI